MCQICDSKKRSAVKVNGVEFCHECLRFFENLAKCNSRSMVDEIDHQTKYILNQRALNLNVVGNKQPIIVGAEERNVMYKSRAWQIWWQNDPDASKFTRLSKTMCCQGVNIPELTREAFLAGVTMRPYIKKIKTKPCDTCSESYEVNCMLEAGYSFCGHCGRKLGSLVNRS